MKRNSFSRTVDDQEISSVEDGIVDDERYDAAVSKASADYYAASWKRRIEDRQQDIWVAVALYLVLSGVALVVL